MMSLVSFLTILLDGLAFGMILFIISVGLTITMGLMRVINLAHGAFAMVGGYVVAILTGDGMNLWLAILIGCTAAGLLGGLAEMTILRPLYRKGEMAQVLLTFGLAFVSISALTEIFGPNPIPVVFPDYMTGQLDIGFRTYPAYRLFLIGVGLVMALCLWYLIDKTLYGARLRAAVDNPNMARAVGMNVSFLFTITFVGGSALAGLGGAIGAGILPLEPFYSLKYVVLFLIVVIVGGEGSFKGSFAAAIAVGLVDTAGKFLIPDVAPYLIYIVVFLLLLWRPNGLLPPKSVA
ncbi:MAG: branched-chain amino acid ABC transporter permease [Rhodospirillaceae bacterium]|nr:branched-chain amino acid ABC transporter permease [Rhodospirillaceae bacterium]MBT4118416.1 branched-chain amino acid ABC transporter permease [Rhodospirillaceae bacterium]MBT4671872.1 branched-chain amino acid ABC transporter permease [Rhodospirillaceae bacterium]MBT4721086.1 branched-chain amino acid ABC transporter permease [Rhodospirillaceae bacterium]MBT4751884.1 branched-chain amino acid ABC transporter permease [Rhodospirillaceae bacterium]